MLCYFYVTLYNMLCYVMFMFMLCYITCCVVLTHQFNVELQRCLAYCGLDTSRYKSQSFGIGGACHAADRGYSDGQIRALGRWKSDAFKVYLRSEVLQAN